MNHKWFDNGNNFMRFKINQQIFIAWDNKPQKLFKLNLVATDDAKVVSLKFLQTKSNYNFQREMLFYGFGVYVMV